MRAALLAAAVVVQVVAFVPASAVIVSIQPAPQVAVDQTLVARLVVSVSNPRLLDQVIAEAIEDVDTDTVVVAVEEAVNQLAADQPLLAEGLVRLASRQIMARNVSVGVQLVARTSIVIAASDAASASRLILDAAAVVAVADPGAATDLGAAASIVATTASQQGDVATAMLVTTAVETSGNSALTASFTTSGGNTGTTASEMIAAAESVGDVTPAAGSEGGDQPPAQPSIVDVPVVAEPNPQQAASPT